MKSYDFSVHWNVTEYFTNIPLVLKLDLIERGDNVLDKCYSGSDSASLRQESRKMAILQIS